MTIVANPRQFKIPDWFLNRQKDYKDGKYSQVVSNALDMKLRDDLERLKKIRFALILSRGLFQKEIRCYCLCCHFFPVNFSWYGSFVQESPWSPSLLGSSSARTAHQNHWPQGEDCWCLQEAMILLCRTGSFAFYAVFFAFQVFSFSNKKP